MPHSMTGFGAAEGPFAGGRVAVEIRSVNHRHLQVQCRMPPRLQELETPIRNRVRERVARGHVTVSIGWVEEAERAATWQVDTARARALQAAIEELGAALGLDDHVGLSFYARQSDVLRPAEESGADVEPEELLAIVDEALDALVTSREVEGRALEQALVTSLDAIQREAERVTVRAPERLELERRRLRERVSDLLGGGQVNEERLELEILLLADKVDIAEELVRLETHVQAARQALAGEEPAGKRLGFLNQELLREINTIGSKAADAEIVRSVIEMKTEVEKLREQVENLE